MSAPVRPQVFVDRAIRRLRETESTLTVERYDRSREQLALLGRTISHQIGLLQEALDYFTDWHKAPVKDRGPRPEGIYRREIALAIAICDFEAIQ